MAKRLWTNETGDGDLGNQANWDGMMPVNGDDVTIDVSKGRPMRNLGCLDGIDLIGRREIGEQPAQEAECGGGTRLFQINEQDLADLERILPNLADALVPHLNTPLKVQIRRVKDIVSNVRWNYGPPTHVEVIPA